MSDKPSASDITQAIWDLNGDLIAATEHGKEMEEKYVTLKADYFTLVANYESFRLQFANSEWLPIETAPKDGTHIIGYEPPCMKRGGVIGVFWLKPYKRKFLDMGEVNMGGQWRYSVHDQVVAEPTHWMPLPEVPTP